MQCKGRLKRRRNGARFHAALKSYGKLHALTTFQIGPDAAPEGEQKLHAALPKVRVVR